MKGLFDCLRNRIYREDEDILKQIAANAAVDDTEIEAFEADDEDDEDELDLGGINVDEIDDADIERVTNEFNMDEGNRAACRLKTIDLKEDMEMYDEGLRDKIKATKAAKKEKRHADCEAIDRYQDAEDDEIRNHNRNMRKIDGEYKDARKASKDKYKAAKKEIWKGKKEDVELEEDAVELQPETKLNKKVSNDPDGRDFVGAGDGSGHDMKNEAFDLIMEEVRNEIAILDEVFDTTGAKDVKYKNVDGGKAKFNKGNSKNVVDSFDAGAKFKKGNLGKVAKGAAIGAGVAGAAYGAKKLADHIKAKRAKKAKEVAVAEGVSLEEAMDYVLECENNLLAEGYELHEIYEEDAVELQPETKLNKKVSQDPDGRDFVGAGDGSGHDMKNEEVLDEVFDTTGAKDVKYKNVDNGNALQVYGAGSKANRKNVLNADGSKIKSGLGKKVAKGAAIGVGVGAAAYGAKKLADHIKAKRAAKAKEIAVAEGISLEEAYDFILECENDLLNEGYEIEEIYEEDAVELQPETKLNKKVSNDDDMREFVGASKGAQDNLKTEAAILAYEEGITLDEAMAWLLEDEEYEEDAVEDAIAKLGKDGNDNGVFPTRVDLQDEVYDEDGDPDECAPKRQHQAPVGDVKKVSVDGIDTDDELILGVEAVIREIEESLDLDLDDFDC